MLLLATPSQRIKSTPGNLQNRQAPIAARRDSRRRHCRELQSVSSNIQQSTAFKIKLKSLDDSLLWEPSSNARHSQPNCSGGGVLLLTSLSFSIFLFKPKQRRLTPSHVLTSKHTLQQGSTGLLCPFVQGLTPNACTSSKF